MVDRGWDIGSIYVRWQLKGTVSHVWKRPEVLIFVDLLVIRSSPVERVSLSHFV